MPPRPERRPVHVVHHGESIVDDYAWMRTKDEHMRRHLAEENAYAEATTTHLESLRTAFYNTLLSRTIEDDSSVPAPRGAWSYYHRLVPGAAYAVHCRRPRDGGEECLILDENRRAEGQRFYKLGTLSHDPSARHAAVVEDTQGDERFTLRLLHVASQAWLDDVVTDVKPGIAWLDDLHFLYTVADEVDRPWRVLRHRVGTPKESDVVVYEDPDKAFYVSVQRTLDGAFVIISSAAKVTGEAHVIATSAPLSSPKCIWKRRHGVEIELDHSAGKFWLLTNLDAPCFRLLSAPVEEPTAWHEEVAHRPDATPEAMLLLRDHGVLFERSIGLPQVRVLPRDGSPAWQVSFPEPTYALSHEPNLEADCTVVRVGYASPITPASTLEIDLVTREVRTLKTAPVPNVDLTKYRCERYFVPAADGTPIPVSLLCAADAVPDAKRPLFLLGYGSYGISYDTGFVLSRLGLVDHGAVVAVAHIRGGGECGRGWYHAGRFEHKWNTFRDFIAVAEGLKTAGWANRIVASGGSAGGLLMGTVGNERPDLFDAILARVPFVDALHTMRDETLPLTVTEYDEWGNPNEPGAGAMIRSYAPYDNVKSQAYPPVLATAGWNDPRVGFWEPAKWVARLRDRATTEGPFLLRTNLDAGHGGASGRYGAFAETAWELAWVLDRMGLAVR